MTFFEQTSRRLNLRGNGALTWRKPQLGAIGALLQSFSLDDEEPPLISIPTGTGKTAVAMIAPHLMSPSPRRVLIVEPSVELRHQIAEEAEGQRVLRELGCIPTDADRPSVLELKGRVKEWSDVLDADFVVSHPQSISPSHYEASPPPNDLFDLVIVDEAHHLGAPTWRAILDYFKDARVILLTATPFRRDQKRIPGRLAYHYPLRSAISEGIYNPVIPDLLPVATGEARASVDARIAARAAEHLASTEHENSTMLIRGSTVERAKELAELYRVLGIHAEILHSRLGEKRKAAIIERIRSGEARAVAVVGMLGEGFDLPRLRIAAYHDKHRSTQSTIQLIGRLARTHPDFPQQSVLVAAQDADVYPELRDVVRRLYVEDADWARVLPGLIDEEVARREADQAYVHQFTESRGAIDPMLLTPLNRGSIYEMSQEWMPDFQANGIETGQIIGGATVVYAGTNEDNTTLVVATRKSVQPRWSKDAGLQNVEYGLTVISYRSPPQVEMPTLLVENSDSPRVLAKLRERLGIDEFARRIDPELVSQYLDGLERTSISSVGLRAEASYRNLMGRNVAARLRASDTAQAGLGHVMLQTSGADGRSITVGGATAKGKVWSTQYTSLRVYDEWVSEVTNRIWFARVGPSGPILPSVSRGARLVEWPNTPIVSVDFAPELHSGGWSLHTSGDVLNLEDVVLGLATNEWGAPSPDAPVEIQASLTGDEESPFWRGALHVSGEVRTLTGTEVQVRRGYGVESGLDEFLQATPPSIHFLDGRRVEGHVVYDGRARRTTESLSILRDEEWGGTDISAETRATALKRDNGMQSVHEAVERMILASPKRGRRRWVMCNDGKGELADYVVLEDLGRSGVALEFWHAKAAGGKPGVRITDLQVVTAQALRSRRFLPSRQLWGKFHKRLNRDEFPHLALVDGSDPECFLRARLGFDHSRQPRGWHRSWRVLQPKPEAKIVIVQPGLSRQDILDQAASTSSPSSSANDALSLLDVFQDFAVAEGWTAEVVCSP